MGGRFLTFVQILDVKSEVLCCLSVWVTFPASRRLVLIYLTALRYKRHLQSVVSSGCFPLFHQRL